MSYPSVVEPVASWLDDQLWKVLESATGLSIPRTSSNSPWNCVLPIPVMERNKQTFQEWVVRLPVRLGGFGIRSLKETSSIAFLGALEQAIPAFQGQHGTCPQLVNIMGGEECFGEEATGDRWRVMLGSGSREGVELRRLWSSLQEEERQAATWLELDMQENLGQQVADVGGSSRDGSTRGKVAEERDITWAKLVKKPKTEQTDQFGLGSSGTNYQQPGCKPCQVQRQPSQVQSFQKLLLPCFAFHRQPVQTDWAKL